MILLCCYSQSSQAGTTTIIVIRMRALNIIVKLLLLQLLLVSYLNGSECVTSEPSANVCPAWMYPNPQQHNECVCGNRLGGAVLCDQESLTVYLLDFYCILYSEELNTTLIGTCPYFSKRSFCIAMHHTGPSPCRPSWKRCFSY